MKLLRRCAQAPGAMPGADAALISLCVERRRLWDAENAHWEARPNDDAGAYRIADIRCDVMERIIGTDARDLTGVIAKLEDAIAWRDQPAAEDEYDMQALRSALADLKRIAGGAA